MVEPVRSATTKPEQAVVRPPGPCADKAAPTTSPDRVIWERELSMVKRVGAAAKGSGRLTIKSIKAKAPNVGSNDLFLNIKASRFLIQDSKNSNSGKEKVFQGSI